jgi:hypothetical protein
MKCTQCALNTVITLVLPVVTSSVTVVHLSQTTKPVIQYKSCPNPKRKRSLSRRVVRAMVHAYAKAMELIINIIQAWMGWSLIGHATLHAVLTLFNNENV